MQELILGITILLSMSTAGGDRSKCTFVKPGDRLGGYHTIVTFVP